MLTVFKNNQCHFIEFHYSRFQFVCLISNYIRTISSRLNHGSCLLSCSFSLFCLDLLCLEWSSGEHYMSTNRPSLIPFWKSPIFKVITSTQTYYFIIYHTCKLTIEIQRKFILSVLFLDIYIHHKLLSIILIDTNLHRNL